MDTAEEYTVYAARCASGAVERHPMTKRSVWKSCLADLERFDRSKDCGPHTLLSSLVVRSPWTVAVEPAQSASSSDVVKAGALKFRCPRCGVSIGEPCENLTERRAGVIKATSWPHPERVEAWGQL